MTTMLPAAPKSLGRLGEVLKSACASVVGSSNELRFESKRAVCVLLIDGLGYANLKEAGAHASLLNSKPIEKISCYFPATTSTSLSSLATGLAPWQTKFTGYLVFDRDKSEAMNLLSGWPSFEEGVNFQPLTTFSESLVEKGRSFHVVSASSYADSGFTGATMRKAKYHKVDTVEHRFDLAAELLKSEQGVIYLYVPELDQAAHAFGNETMKWLNLLEAVDSLIQSLVSKLPKDAGLVITSDHGVIEVPPENHVYLDTLIDESLLSFVGGDTRGLQLYLKDPATLSDLKASLNQSLGSLCYIVEPIELVESGWWAKPPMERFRPDLIVLAKKQVALYHRTFAKKKSLAMVGHHGSISDSEISVPLIRFNL